MAKTFISPSSDNGGAAVYPVFVDTNLDTHLALIVSDTDTVSDLKMKVILEHPQCFPTVGKIKVNALQVKRRGRFYHLSDSMLVKNVFAGAKKSWYVYVDASSLEEQILEQHMGKPDSSNQLALPWVSDSPSYERLSKHHESTALKPDQRVLPAELSSQGDSYGEIPRHVGTNNRYIADNQRRIVSSDSDKRSGLEVQKYDAGSEGIVSKKRLRVTQRDSSMEGGSDSGPAARKKRKTERNECSGNSCGEDKVLINGTIDVTSKVDAINQETFHLQQGKSRNATSASLFAGDLNNGHLSTHSIGQAKKHIKDRKKEKCKILSVTPLNQQVTVVPEVQEVEEKRTFKENVETIRKRPNTVADVAVIPEQVTQHRPLSEPSGFSKKESCRELVQEVFEGLSKHGEDENEVFPTPLIKELHDLKKNGNYSAQNNIGFDGQMFEGEQADKCERNKGALLSHDPEVKLSERGECVSRGDKDASYKEPLLTSKLSDPKGALESENTVVGKRKKQKTKKSSTRNEDESVLKDRNAGVNRVSISGPNPSFDGELIDETRKEGKKISEKRAADAEKVISNEPEFSPPMATDKHQRNAAHLNEKSRKKSDNLGGGKRRNTSANITDARNENESVVKHDSDDPCATKKEDKILLHTDSKGISEKKSLESHMNSGGEGDKLLESGVEPFLPTETNRGQLDEAYVFEASKGCENARANRKKQQKVRKVAARDEHASVMKHDTDAVVESPSAVPNPASVGRSFDKLQTDECLSFHMERTGLPEEKTADAPHRVPDRGSDDVIREEAETLQSSERDRRQESVKEKPRNKRKKSQRSTAESFQGFPTQEQEGEVDHSHLNQVHSNQEYAPRMDRGIDEVTTVVTNVVKSKTSGLELSSGLKLESEKNNGIEHTSSLSQKIPKDVCLSEIPPSPVIENIVEADTGDQVNVSNGEGEGIDFKQYFVPGENHTEGAPTNKVKETGKLGKLMKSKSKGKVDVPSVGNSQSQQKSLLSADNHGDETSQMKKFTSTQSRGPLSVVENNDIVSSSKKSPEVSVDEMKAPNSHPVDQIKTPKMARQSDVRSDSRVNRSAHAAKGNNRSLVESSSNSERSVRSRRGILNNKRNLSLDQSDMAVGKSAAKNTGEVVNNSKHKKSLLATPGTIFGDDSSNSSADDNGTVDSDASTRTPSDKLLSSESEGESDSSLDSGKHGSSAATGKGGRSFLVDSQNSDMKEKTFGEILRSSSRFKKAKLTASQFLDLEDVEDIVVDVVPDSQPNT